MSLSGCLLAALVSAIVTVRLTARLFRRTEWQANVLSRVSRRAAGQPGNDCPTIVARASRRTRAGPDSGEGYLRALGSDGSVAAGQVEDCRRLVDEAMRNVRELSHA
jgi:hypothetical protein